VKKLMLATTSLLSLSVISASAADLAPVYAKAAPMPPSAFSWTGCYVGVHAGGGGMHDSFTGEFGAGALAGAQGGCNYQTGMLVVGIEGEGWWSGIKSDFNRTTDSEGFFTNERTSNKYDYSIAGRAGVAFDRALVYLKGGWVWGRFDFYDQEGCTAGCTTVTSTASQTLNGPLIGVGVEYAFTNNWTAKVEYNYANYRSRMIRLTCQSGCSPFGEVDSQGAEKHIIKIGVNYLFNSTSSSLARN
jgi:outer membrane immunogenic protein